MPADKVRSLTEGDALPALELLRARPLANVFLEHVVRTGALGRLPGLWGCERAGRLIGLLMVSPGGGSALELAREEACAPLAECAARHDPRPRHIIGRESVTEPFWGAYRELAGPLRWSRREPVYCVEAASFRADELRRVRLERAREADLDTVVMHSARQHLEDLGDDRYTGDPEGFRARHRIDVREGRWWVLRDAGRLCFQAHVGPSNDHTVQIGGVFTAPDRRGRGLATRGVAALVARLLERHPSVTLFCDEANRTARGVYERVGFEVVAYNRSYLLEP